MKPKTYKCKYCGAAITWEADAKGKRHAVERTVYYRPDPHGNTLILTMKGEIVRAVEDRTSDRVGSVLHSSRCTAAPKYITSNKKKPIDYLPDAPKAEKPKPAAPPEIRTSLFN